MVAEAFEANAQDRSDTSPTKETEIFDDWRGYAGPIGPNGELLRATAGVRQAAVGWVCEDDTDRVRRMHLRIVVTSCGRARDVELRGQIAPVRDKVGHARR